MKLAQEPTIKTTRSSFVVTEGDLASSIAVADVGGTSRTLSDVYPRVLSTSRVIDLATTTSARIVKPVLRAGEALVTARVEISHSAPTPAGETVTVVAHYLGPEKEGKGQQLKFDAVLSDDGGEIGRASVWLTVVCGENTENMAFLRVSPRPLFPGSRLDFGQVVRYGSEEFIKLWLGREGAAVNLTREQYYKVSPLHTAARFRDARILGLLLSSDAAANVVIPPSVLAPAVERGCTEMVKLLLDKGVSEKLPDTLLYQAARTGNVAVVGLLLERGLDINAPTSVECWTPLMEAIDCGRTGMVKYLLDRGADPNPADDEGWRCLHFAVNRGDDEAVRFLLDSGAETHWQNMRKDTPLILAARVGEKRVAQTLLEYGADPSLGIGRCSAWEWVQGRKEATGLTASARCGPRP